MRIAASKSNQRQMHARHAQWPCMQTHRQRAGHALNSYRVGRSRRHFELHSQIFGQCDPALTVQRVCSQFDCTSEHHLQGWRCTTVLLHLRHRTAGAGPALRLHCHMHCQIHLSLGVLDCMSLEQSCSRDLIDLLRLRQLRRQRQ